LRCLTRSRWTSGGSSAGILIAVEVAMAPMDRSKVEQRTEFVCAVLTGETTMAAWLKVLPEGSGGQVLPEGSTILVEHFIRKDRCL
jgi:hypothetical protein